MTEITYLRLPKQVDDKALLARVNELRELRLLSLQTDPSSFITRYEDEVDQPTKFWVDRHQHPEAEHFVTQVETNLDDKTFDDGTPKYVAFLVLIRRGHWRPEESEPEASNPILPLGNNQQPATDEMPIFSMEALYVEPRFRRQGICGRLIQKMMQWIGEEIRTAKMDKAKILTTVAEENTSAKDVYLNQGFRFVSRTSIQDKAGNQRAVLNLEYIMNCGGT